MHNPSNLQRETNMTSILNERQVRFLHEQWFCGIHSVTITLGNFKSQTAVLI
jgi:hypothetical protein